MTKELKFKVGDKVICNKTNVINLKHQFDGELEIEKVFPEVHDKYPYVLKGHYVAMAERELEYATVTYAGKEYPVDAFFAVKEIVAGVGTDAPTVENANGGKQSKVLYRMDLIDPLSILEVGKVLHEGAVKYGEENWRLIDVKDHINHLLIHAYAYLAGDTSDDHLSHVACRAIFAMATHKTQQTKEENKHAMGKEG